MSRGKFLWRFLPTLALLMVFLSGCGDKTTSTLNPQGPVAKEQLNLMLISLAVMIFVFIVVMVIYVYVLVRFRKRAGDNSIPKQVEGNHVLEIIWTVIPILLLLVIAVPTVTYTFKHSQDDRNDPDALQVKVTGHQFWWEFQYPGLEIRTAQDLYIPVGKKVVFELTSADVNHSFWVPALAGKIDTNPGTNKNVLSFTADNADVYLGKCAELCGASHALMDFKVVAVSQIEFDQWVADMKVPAPTNPATAKGAELFKNNCLACHAITPNGPGAYPNLNGFANRIEIAGILPHNDENLANWIRDPNKEKIGNMMPKLNLKEDEITELVKYLNTLK